MINAAQDVLEAQHDEATGGVVPRRVQVHGSRIAGDHHGPAALAQRHVTDRQLDHIS
jgi:hypothetical protein